MKEISKKRLIIKFNYYKNIVNVNFLKVKNLILFSLNGI